MRGQGRTYRRGETWWVEFWRNGIQYRESAKSTKEADAKRLLKQKQSEILKDTFVPLAQKKLTVSELLDLLEKDHEINRRKGLAVLRFQVVPLRKAFAMDRAAELTETRLERYKADRLAPAPVRCKHCKDRSAEEFCQHCRPKAPATVNKELAALRRAFRIAIKRKLLSASPNFEMLRVSNARQGFFEEPEFLAAQAQLPEDLRDLVEFSYLTGWRRGEVLSLGWSQVDFAAGTVRLEPGTTKNEEGRTFPFAALPRLADLLRRQLAKTEALERSTGRLIPWVFHRGGRPIRSFKNAWEAACERAGLEGRLVHDFRRTAVRNLVRAGVPETVAMKLTGHRTRAIFDRYNITSGRDLHEAVAKLAAFHGSAPEGRGTVVAFKKTAEGGA